MGKATLIIAVIIIVAAVLVLVSLMTGVFGIKLSWQVQSPQSVGSSIPAPPPLPQGNANSGNVIPVSTTQSSNNITGPPPPP